MGRILNALLPTTTPVPFAAHGQRAPLGILGGGLAGARAQLRAMGQVGTLFSIVNRTSTSTSRVNWRLYRKAKSGRPEDRVEVTSHAALDLWNRPNRFFTRQEFVETEQQHIDLTGEGWWVLARSPRSTIPLEMWPVRPDRMEPVPDPEHYLTGYIYTSPGGERVPLGLDEVIQIRMPNPEDVYRGMGPVQAILHDLDATRYSAAWNANFFRNSAEPGGIVQVPNNLTDEDFNQLRARWNEQHRGVAAAHRVAILEGGMQWIDRKLSQRDMQFAELRDVSSKVIREAFGMPAFALGEVQDVNRASAEASDVWFAKELTVPRLERFKGALNNDLLPMYGPTGEGLEFDYDTPVPADREADAADLTSRANAASTLIAVGLAADEVLPACGLPDMRYVGQRPENTPPAPAPAARRTAARRPADPFAEARARLLAASDDAGDAGDAGDAELEHVRQQHDAALTALLANWSGVEEDWYAALSDQIQAAVDDEDTAALGALTLDTDRAAGVLRQALGAMAQQGAQQVVDEAAAQGVNITAPEADPALTNRAPAVRAFGGELVDIASATAQLLASGMTASAASEALRLFRPGSDGRALAGRVVAFLRGLKGRARTDVLGGLLHRAMNAGRLAALAEGPVAEYFATEVHDANVCEPCASVDGTEFPDLAAAEAAYGGGGYIDCLGGIRCRGTVRAVWDQEGES
ncbi:phage portal protein [Peterkaempfera sp. SMS 1(5)a]|uniref:phage portal protein n=1 Tax=Peterkaempfera podocarpi TaxID=3232308 RepID=UPI0036728265